MTKGKYLKYLIGISIIIMILFICSSTVKAEVLDNENISVSTSKYSSDGSIALKLTGLTLDITHEYSYSLVKTAATEPTKWIELIDLTESSANCTLSASTAEIRAVLKVTNTGYLYIKDTTEDTNVVEKLPINLKLPYNEAIDISYKSNTVSFDRLYDINGASYQFVKIEDESIINAYLQGGKNISAILDMLPTEAPTNGWNTMSLYSFSAYAYEYVNKSSDVGLHLLWAQIYGDGCRTIYGYTLYDNLPIDETAPTIEKIYVSSPESGTYKTGQTIKIRVAFSEAITGTTTPTLKIKFGEGETREVSNGTIVNLGEGDYYWQHYIEYSYNIQDEDKGQLAVVDLIEGDIQDNSGNVATLSCPVLTGNTIKANVEGTTTNNTENQDKENNSGVTTPEDTDKEQEDKDQNQQQETDKNNNQQQETNSNQQNTSTGNQATTTEKDETTAPTTIPHAGLGMGTTIAIVIVLAVGIIVFFKHRELRGV